MLFNQFHAPLLVLTVLLVLLAGCGVVHTNVRYSQPYYKDAELKEVTQKLEHYKLDIRAVNLYMSRDDLPSSKERLSGAYYYKADIDDIHQRLLPINRNYFFIEMAVVPNRLQKFTPNNFVLNIDGKKLLGSLYKAVSRSKHTGNSKRSLETFCDFRMRDAGNEVIRSLPVNYKLLEPFHIKSTLNLKPDIEYCFALRFDIPPPDPETQFSLSLGGLSNESEEVDVIDFKAGFYDWVHN